MFTAAARQLGYRVAVWDPDVDAPAHKSADRSFSAPFTDRDELELFRNAVSAVTYEWENIPVAVASALERSVPVRPGSAILRVLQNRLDHKAFLAEQGFPVAPFRAVLNPKELTKAAEAIGFPCLCKTATAGYDGKGQWRLSSMSDAGSLQERLSQSASPNSRWIVEQFLGFTKELSVLVIRGLDGDQRLYPVADNIHEAGILRTTSIPAEIDRAIAEQAQKTAASAIHALRGVGVFCVELFLMPDGTLLINEIAPRPHNSGHYTLDACAVSQFEQQVRALCGLPLGEVRLLSPAVMINLIGEDLTRALSEDALIALLRVPGTKLHVYGKNSIRPGRKMGHVTFMAEKLEEAQKAALTLQRFLQSPA
ncbi:MAG: 5-(carboxyamino)imidazole ribonucleotide synthase [Nitrospirales bacterium]|nr:5-(carboxyamino)imidazole ribonucleotide synthase [Nitrospirales bacterium]